MSYSFLLEAWLARQVLLQIILWGACLPLINHMLRITNKNQGTRISSRLVQRGSQYLIHFEDEIFYSLACVRCDSSAEKRSAESLLCGCVGGPDEQMQLWLRTLLNHALGMQLFKSFSERNTQISSYLEQECVHFNYEAVNERAKKTTLSSLI